MDVSSSSLVSTVYRGSQEGFRSHSSQEDIKTGKAFSPEREENQGRTTAANMETIPVEERLKQVMDIGEIRRLLYLAGSYEPPSEDKQVGKKADIYS